MLLAEAFGARGYRVKTGASPWRLGAAEQVLLRELAAGVAQAVRETGRMPEDRVSAWLAARSERRLLHGRPHRPSCDCRRLNPRAAASRSRSSRSSRRVNMARVPSGVARPLGLRAVPVQLDAVLVGIAQVERLADAVVAGPVQRDPGREHAAQGVGQLGPARVENGGVEQPRRAGRRRLSAAALPGVEADMVVVAAGRDEGRLAAVALHQFEAEHAAIEGEGAVEIGHLQVDVADGDAGPDRSHRPDRR